MAKKASAGDLYESVAFDKRVTGNPDSPADYGRIEKDWTEQFCCRAGFRHLRGGESVIAGRLQGRSTSVVMVRVSTSTKEIETDWRMRCQGVEYALREKTMTPDRQFFELLVESGVTP